MKTKGSIKSKDVYIRKLVDLAGKLEKGELNFIYFEASPLDDAYLAKGHLILQYQNVPAATVLSDHARQAVAAIKNLANALSQGAVISSFQEEFDPVKGVDYSSLAESGEYGGYQRLVVEWEK